MKPAIIAVLLSACNSSPAPAPTYRTAAEEVHRLTGKNVECATPKDSTTRICASGSYAWTCTEEPGKHAFCTRNQVID